MARNGKLSEVREAGKKPVINHRVPVAPRNAGVYEQATDPALAVFFKENVPLLLVQLAGMVDALLIRPQGSALLIGQRAKPAHAKNHGDVQAGGTLYALAPHLRPLRFNGWMLSAAAAHAYRRPVQMTAASLTSNALRSNAG
jgi:hypothetical protein